MKLSVVIPVYGCPEALEPLCGRLNDTVSKITKDYEIILVNDACPKDSWRVIEKICRTDPKVIGLELSRNFGQEAAIKAGLDYCSGDWVVVMDCDLQDKPEEIIHLYQKACEGYDAVFARRVQRQDKKLKVWEAKQFYKVYSYATGIEYDPAVCNFSVISRQVADAYCRMPERHRGYVMYILWLGFKCTTVDVEHCERYAGESGYTFKKKVDMALELLTSQSDKALRMIVKLGAVFSAISFVTVLFLVIQYFVRNIAPGWTSIIAAVFLVGGLVLIALGVVGLYIGNIFMEVKNRPLYVVRSVCRMNTDRETADHCGPEEE